MADKSSVKYPFSVEWSTKLPFVNMPSISPIFTVLKGMELYLQLSYEGRFFYLSIFEKNRKWYVLHKFGVTTFIRDSCDVSKLIVYTPQTSSQNPSSVIWRKTPEEISVGRLSIFDVGHLTIICVFDSRDNHLSKTPPAYVSTQTDLSIVDLQSLSRDFSTFLKDKTYSDVKLKCASHTLSANRSVLAARSKVFAAMFRNKMAETENGVVHIKDEDPEVLKLLLEYMYSAKMPNLREETAPLLYQAANKYAVYGLRRACADWMVEHQTTDNCLDLLVLAEKHLDENFKDAIACFVAEHLPDLSVESWSTFKKDYPLLVLSLLEKRFADSMPGAAKRAKC